MSADTFDLGRFVEAQDRSRTYERALSELRAGRKQGHWIWFVFPQIDGLGSSETARFYAICSLEEARAYLQHPVLGPRLVEAAEAMLGLPTRDPEAVLGAIDAMKLRSSMTLFSRLDAAASVFEQVIDEFYAGLPDRATIERLERD
jgi:uncharacterized protein (DUF1810 family)